VLTEELALEPVDPDAPGAFRLSRRGALAELLERAGFGDVQERESFVRPVFTSGEEYARYVQEMSSALRQALEVHPAPARERAWEAVARAADAWRAPGGELCLESAVWIVSGSK
jgi:hypothetical protein